MSKPKIKIGPIKTENPTETSDKEFTSLKTLNEYLKTIVEDNVFFMFIELLKKISTDYNIPVDELNDKYLSYFQKDLKNSQLYCEFLSLNINKTDVKQILSSTEPDAQPIPKTVIHTKNPNPSPSQSVEPEILENKCLARTGTNVQCSRKKQPSSDFCGSHLHSQPFGRIDQPPLATAKPKSKKTTKTTTNENHTSKTPPPPTTTPQTSPTQSAQIEAVIETINGIDYIVDSNTNNIYKIPDDFGPDTTELNMEGLKLAGKKLDDQQIVWYSEADLLFIA